MDTFKDAIARARLSVAPYLPLWQANYDYIEGRRPKDSAEKKSAFASSVLQLTHAVYVTPEGYPGPNIRAYACELATVGPKGKLIPMVTGGFSSLAMAPDGSLPVAGFWNIDAARQWCEYFCFCSLGNERGLFELIWQHETHYDNDLTDREVMTIWTGKDNQRAGAPTQGSSAHYALVYDPVDQRYYNNVRPTH